MFFFNLNKWRVSKIKWLKLNFCGDEPRAFFILSIAVEQMKFIKKSLVVWKSCHICIYSMLGYIMFYLETQLRQDFYFLSYMVSKSWEFIQEFNLTLIWFKFLSTQLVEPSSLVVVVVMERRISSASETCLRKGSSTKKQTWLKLMSMFGWILSTKWIFCFFFILMVSVFY